MSRVIVSTISESSPSAPGTTVGGSVVDGIIHADSLTIVAAIRGATGGTLDVYLQTLIGGTWYDFAHFPQLAAAAALTTRVWHVCRGVQQTTLTTIGSGTSPALAANSIVGGTLGESVRALYVAGAGTSLGAAQSIVLVQHCPRLQ